MIDNELDNFMLSFKEARRIGIEKLLGFLRPKSKEGIKAFISDMDDDLLDYLCKDLAMASEDYEICQAVIEIKEDRINKY